MNKQEEFIERFAADLSEKCGILTDDSRWEMTKIYGPETTTETALLRMKAGVRDIFVMSE